jgi:uncharacterized membrane protein YheB (UPF0754 family)
MEGESVQYIEWLKWLSIPLIAALIGWVTNYLAVKMIFRPRRPIRILGITIQGLIPKRQMQIAVSIGETVARDLLSHDDIKGVLTKLDLKEQVLALVDTQINTFTAKFPMIAMFLQGEALQQVKSTIAAEIENSLPQFLDNIMIGVEKNLNFKDIVSSRIQGFDLSKLEEIVYRISAQELRAIEYLGGVLGFIVGLVQLLLI